jgi:hypothetical protein
LKYKKSSLTSLPSKSTDKVYPNDRKDISLSGSPTGMTADIFNFVRFPKRNDTSLSGSPTGMTADIFNFVRFPKMNDSLCPVPQKE